MERNRIEIPKAVPEPTFCKTVLNKTGIPGYRYCLNPYFGCSHGCLYCYADTVPRFSGRAFMKKGNRMLFASGNIRN
jgi:DNA repair photolyase